MAGPRLDFMVIGLPRSATTWAANWLNTAQTLCVHDPLWETHYDDIDQCIAERAGDRQAGISCTGIWMWPDWVNRHPARKVVVRRPLVESNRSLARIGLPSNPANAVQCLDRIDGFHVPYSDLFTPRAEVIWSHLTGLPFDAQRHRELVTMRIEPNFDTIRPDPHTARRLYAEVCAITATA